MKSWLWGGVALWMAIVVAGSGLAWFAIDRAGRQVSTAEPLVPDRTGATSTPDTAAPSPTPTTHPTTPTSSTPTPTVPTPTAAPSRSPTTEHPRFRTWTGTAGSVTVSCSGSQSRLVGASPADGWRAERQESDDDISVTFERNEVEVEVQARCTASGPVFEVDSHTEDEGQE